MLKKNIFMLFVLFLSIPVVELLSNEPENFQEQQRIPKWIVDFAIFLKSETGEEFRERTEKLVLGMAQSLGQNIGYGVALSAEELAKGLMRGLTDPKTSEQFIDELNKIYGDLGKKLVGTSGNVITEARKELFKQADLAADDTVAFAGRTTKKIWDGFFTNFEDMSKDFEKEFEKGGHSYELIKKDAQVITRAFGDAGAEVTKGINENFGKGSASYENVQKTMDDFGDLAQRSVNYLQEMLIFDTFKYLGAGISVVMIPTLGLRYTYHYFISKLKDPRIIIETSIGSWSYEMAKWIFRFKPRRAAEKLEDMILAPKVKARIQEIIDFEKAHRQAKEGFDNILLTGNPGTGKTMFAKAIAAELGMDYIVLTGSSFFQENAGVKALDQIFGKMTRGRKVVIFIDEIDSITASRVGKNSDSDAYRLLNQLLNYTSTPNKNFILIGATNYPELIDKAFYRRFQHVVEMPLPEYAQRVQFLAFAKNKYLMTKNKKYNEVIDTIFTDKIINDVATKTEGLSYAELQTIIDHIKSASRLSKTGITKAIIYDAMTKVKAKESSFQKNFLKK